MLCTAVPSLPCAFHDSLGRWPLDGPYERPAAWEVPGDLDGLQESRAKGCRPERQSVSVPQGLSARRDLDWMGAAPATLSAWSTSKEKMVSQLEVAHDAAGIVELRARVAKLAPAVEIPIAIERPTGLTSWCRSVRMS